MATRRQQTAQFRTRGSDGQHYIVTEYTTYQDFGGLSSSRREWVEGFKELRVGNQPINVYPDGSMSIVGTDITLTRVP